MSNYSPPYTISNRMLELVASISEKIGKIISHKELESKPHLRRNNRIKSIHSSLKIEANSLSLSEVRDVIDGHLVLGNQKEIQEVKNAYAAYEKIEEINPYSISELKYIHGILTFLTVTESGTFRKGVEGVFSGDNCIFVAPPPHMVPELMNRLFDWMDKNRDKVHPLILSAIFHYEFVFIHPFADAHVIIGTRLEKPSKINGFALLSPNFFMPERGERNHHASTYIAGQQYESLIAIRATIPSFGDGFDGSKSL